MLQLRLAGHLAALAPHALASAGRAALGRPAAATGASGSSGSSVFIVPNGTFFVELIIFVLVFGALAKFVLPSIEQVMGERQARIRAGIASGEEGRAEADRLAAERARLLETARAEARALLEQASRGADAALEDARRRGMAEHDRLLADARPGLEAEREQLRADLLGRLGGLVVDAASRVIGERIELYPHRALIEELAVSASVPHGAGGRARSGGGPQGDGAPAAGDTAR